MFGPVASSATCWRVLDEIGDVQLRRIAKARAQVRARVGEALVHQVRITDEGIIPVFKIPGPGAIVIDDAAPATRTTGSRNGAVGGGGGTRTHTVSGFKPEASAGWATPPW